MSAEDEEEPKIVPAPVGARPAWENKRLPASDWEVIIDAYERGTSTLAELSARFGISRTALHKRFKKDSIVRGSKTAVVQAEKEIERFIEKRSAWIEETRLEGFKALKQVQMIARKIVLDQVKASKNIGDVDVDLRAIGRLNKILCDNVTTSLNILEADKHVDDKSLPMLIVEDLTDQEILDHHISTGAMDENATLEDQLRESLEDEDD